jgi:SAM-dependent methyltransferase
VRTPGLSASASASAEVADDGSPVEVFARLPPGPGPGYIESAVRPSCQVLDLGCGAGRISRELARRGHQVVAVDQSDAMLSHLDAVSGIEAMRADIGGLQLGRRFGGVVLGSYLINHPTRGAAYLDSARRHVAADGAVVIQRYDPAWARAELPDRAQAGDVTIEVTRLELVGTRLAASVSYTIGRRQWCQDVEAVLLDDDAVDALASGAGLVVDRWIDEYRTWGRLIEAGAAHRAGEPGVA